MNMKAKHIAKLRKKIAKFTSYTIRESLNLFGEPYCSCGCGKNIMSDSPINALRKFCVKYARRYKRKFKYSGYDTQTTYDWGKVEVINNKTGFRTYYM